MTTVPSTAVTRREPELPGQTVVIIGGSAAFDATDQAALERFFAGLPSPVDHVMVTGPGPYYAPLAELDRERTHRAFASSSSPEHEA